MSDVVVPKALVPRLHCLFVEASNELAEGLGGLLGRSGHAEPGDLFSEDPGIALRTMGHRSVAIGFAFGHKDFANQSIQLLLPEPVAKRLATALAKGSAEIGDTGSEPLSDADLEQLAKITAPLSESLERQLQVLVGVEAGTKCKDGPRVLDATEHGESWFPAVDELVGYRSSFEIDGLGELRAIFLTEFETASKWNAKPIDSAFGREVPTRGTIACYFADAEPYALMRQACKRIGLEIDSRPSSEVPNPAEHRGRVVFIDVPVRGDYRFRWCERIKAYDATNSRVVLLIREPSRQRVVSGFVAKADIILGWPIDEGQLASKLEQAIDELPEYQRPSP